MGFISLKVVVVIVVLVLVVVVVVMFCKNLKDISTNQHRWRIQYTKIILNQNLSERFRMLSILLVLVFVTLAFVIAKHPWPDANRSLLSTINGFCVVY